MAKLQSPDQPPGGLEEEFRRIYDQYNRPVHRLFANQGFTHDECLDLTQETFLRVSRNRRRLPRVRNLGGYILRIACNVWKNELRRQKAGIRFGKEVPLDESGRGSGDGRVEAGIARASQQPRPDERLQAREELALVEQEVLQLPPCMQKCFLLNVGQGMKYREIADLLDLSIETVKSQIHQARQRLQAALDHHLGRRPG